jgi:hypothetical protein
MKKKSGGKGSKTKGFQKGSKCSMDYGKPKKEMGGK